LKLLGVATAWLSFIHSSGAQTAVGTVTFPSDPDNGNSYGGQSLRYSSAGTLYDWDGLNVYRLDGGSFTQIGQVPGNSADPGPINFSSDGQNILLGNGYGGQQGGSYDGEIFSLPIAGGTTSTPVGNVPGNDDFVPIPASSSIANSSVTKFFVNGASGIGYDSDVSVFDSSTGTDTPVIQIPGASASMALNASNHCLYVEDGYDYSTDGSSFTGEIRSFTLAQIDTALNTDTPLSFTSGKLFNVLAGSQSGDGLFFDKDGFLLAGGDDPNTYDGGVVAFYPNGSIANFTDFGTYTDIVYNPASDQVLVVPYGASSGSVYDAVDLEPEPTSVGFVGFAGLLLLRRRKPRSVKRCALAAAAASVSMASLALAGPYSPAGGQTGSTAISATSSGIAEWASGASIVRGLRDVENPTEYSSTPSSPLNYAYYGGSDGASAAASAASIAAGGPAIASTANTAPIGQPPQPQSTSYGVALGQNGSATLTFPTPIANGPGADFAVFGNGFSTGSLEWAKLAYVEVSSDGVNFFSFPAVSLTPTTSQVGNYGELDPTNLYDLAGKDPAGYGTPFDLSELAGTPGLNMNDIIAVRVVAISGDINPAFANLDSDGNIINGAFPAPSQVGSEGFDLAAVAVINEVPEPGPSSIAALSIGCLAWKVRRRPARG
jgi:hypothetical protein